VTTSPSWVWSSRASVSIRTTWVFSRRSMSRSSYHSGVWMEMGPSGIFPLANSLMRMRL